MIMNITEKSKEYAQGKALDAITAAIEQAYADGYNDGLKHYETETLEAIKDGVEYVDLGFPNGPLWSSRCIKDKNDTISLFAYVEASKLCIPTKEQFEELCSNCKVKYINYKNPVIEITGITGNKIVLEIPNLKYDDFKPYYCYFWLKDDEKDNNERNYAIVHALSESEPFSVKKLFMGYKLPVMLVKNK